MSNACKDPERLLDLVDFVVFCSRGRADEMTQILYEAGSAWTVAAVGAAQRLERRVPEEIATQYEKVSSEAARAGEHLREAWRLIYGRHPDPDAAYLEAVKAVEAAAVPVISPNNLKATLATMNGDLKANLGRFEVALRPVDTTIVAVEQALGMMQLLWKSQPERHGSPDPRPLSTVTQQEAEAGVHLAITLVHWFRTGVISKLPKG